MAALYAMIAVASALGQNNIAEEVAWVVGDQPIWKSEIEEQYNNMQYEKMPINGDPYCIIHGSYTDLTVTTAYEV